MMLPHLINIPARRTVAVSLPGEKTVRHQILADLDDLVDRSFHPTRLERLLDPFCFKDALPSAFEDLDGREAAQIGAQVAEMCLQNAEVQVGVPDPSQKR